MLSKSTWPVFKGDERDGCRAILNDLNIKDDIAIGATKIFIKTPESVRVPWRKRGKRAWLCVRRSTRFSFSLLLPLYLWLSVRG
jgi:hypothetical protein